MNNFNICSPDFCFSQLQTSKNNMSQGFCNFRDTTKAMPYSNSGIWYMKNVVLVGRMCNNFERNRAFYEKKHETWYMAS